MICVSGSSFVLWGKKTLKRENKREKQYVAQLQVVIL